MSEKTNKSSPNKPPKHSAGNGSMPSVVDSQVQSHFETLKAAKAAAEGGAQVPLFVHVGSVADTGKKLPCIVNIGSGSVLLTTETLDDDQAFEITEAINAAVEEGVRHGRASARNHMLTALGFRQGQDGEIKISLFD